MNDSQLATFVRGLPKAELHLHIEGTFEPELMCAIGQRNGCKMRFDSVQSLRDAYKFDNLQSFLDIYYEGASVLLHEVDFYDLTWAYLCRAHEDAVRHVELFFDPQTHTERGVAFETVLDGIERACLAAQEQFGMSFELICCFLRHLSAQDAMVTLEQAAKHRARIKAVGLDSSEVGHPPVKFQDVFDRARELGFLTVAHAGEEGPPEYIHQALDLLNVRRIDHGVRAIEDESLVTRLARDEIALTVCPLSNTALKVFDDLGEHTLLRLHQAGVKITLNSDDPSYFGGYINDNFLATANALSLDTATLAEFAKNSFQYSFASDERKAACLAELETYLAK